MRLTLRAVTILGALLVASGLLIFNAPEVYAEHENSEFEWVTTTSPPQIRQTFEDSSFRNWAVDEEIGKYVPVRGNEECPDWIHDFSNSFESAEYHPRVKSAHFLPGQDDCLSNEKTSTPEDHPTSRIFIANADKLDEEDKKQINTTIAAANGDNAKDNEIECDAGFGFSWLICGAISAMQSFMELMKGAIGSLLTISPLERTGDDGKETPVYSIWSSIRDIANVLLIPVFLFLIFAQATSFNIDAYTVKKMIPRLVAAVILIQASFLIVAFSVDISNVLGLGVDQLMTAAVGEEDIQFGDLAGESFSLLATGGLATLGVLIATGGISLIGGGAVTLFVFLLPAIIAIIVTFFTLILRHIVIIMLAVLSPIAFLLWILPNTEKWFKQWLDILMKALLMFPLIIALMASGSIVAVVASNMGGNPVEEFMGALVAFVAVMAPLFLVPLTYKLAGTAMSLVGGGISQLANRGAYGKDGKSGVFSKLNERKKQRKSDMAAGISPENWAGRKIMGTRAGRALAGAGARPGLGFSQRSKSRANVDFRKQLSQANKELEEVGLDDTDILTTIAGEHWNTRPAAKAHIQDLENKGEKEKAAKLKQWEDYAGRNEMQAAALKRAADMGQSDAGSHANMLQTFEGNPEVGEQVNRSALNAAKKAGRPDMKALFTEPDPRKGETSKADVYNNTVKGLNVDDWNKMQDEAIVDKQGNPTELGKAVQRMTQEPGGQATLRNLLGPQSGLSTQKRENIRNLVGRQEAAQYEQPQAMPTDVQSVAGQRITPPSPDTTQGAVPTREVGGQTPQGGGGAASPGQPPQPGPLPAPPQPGQPQQPQQQPPQAPPPPEQQSSGDQSTPENTTTTGIPSQEPPQQNTSEDNNT